MGNDAFREEFFYTVELKRYDIQAAVEKLLKDEADVELDFSWQPEFYDITFVKVSFDYIDGEFFWYYTFRDYGGLKRWKEGV